MENKKHKNREYKSAQIEQDLYQFEMGNELGARLEREKSIHENEYKKQHLNGHLENSESQNQATEQLNKNQSK